MKSCWQDSVVRRGTKVLERAVGAFVCYQVISVNEKLQMSLKWHLSVYAGNLVSASVASISIQVTEGWIRSSCAVVSLGVCIQTE